MHKILFLVSIISMPAFGSDMQNEIDHLLAFVEKTPCQYERNKDMHSGKDAAKHIKRKYDYFKDEIDSTEKFIELSATKSTMSGKYYMIHCTGQPAIKAQDWLLQELKNHRNKKTKT
ncbi:MAG: DUF5329 family protein [Gammaproteobacteria bacterium]